jgi:hypothetical protein
MSESLPSKAHGTSSQDAKVSADDAPGATKRCSVCGETIWVGALKCIHCDADFTWRRFLVFGNTTLALTTALIAVVAASIPAIRLMFTADNSEFSAVFAGISTGGDAINLLFNNSGRRTGAINKVGVITKYADGKQEFSIFPRTKDDAAIFVGPGETKGAEFLFAKAETHWKDPATAKNDLTSLGSYKDLSLMKGLACSVSVSGVNADETKYTQSITINCLTDALSLFHKQLTDADSSDVATGSPK